MPSQVRLREQLYRCNVKVEIGSVLVDQWIKDEARLKNCSQGVVTHEEVMGELKDLCACSQD